MQITIDTLKIYERLRKTNLPDAPAREIAEVFKETTDALSSHLASRQDIEFIVKKEIETLKLSVEKEFETIRKEIVANRKEIVIIQKDSESIRKEIAESKSEIIKWVAGMLVAQAAIVATLVKLL